jgi:hypothetical protein
MANTDFPQSTIISFPGAAGDQAALAEREERQAAIEICLNNVGAIVTLLEETVEGDRFVSARAWLVEQLEKNFVALDHHLGANHA